jgi:hypothetical protein
VASDASLSEEFLRSLVSTFIRVTRVSGHHVPLEERRLMRFVLRVFRSLVNRIVRTILITLSIVVIRICLKCRQLPPEP